MRSSNPAFSRRPEFGRSGQYQAPQAPQYGQPQAGQQYGQSSGGQQPYSQQAYQQPGQAQWGTPDDLDRAYRAPSAGPLQTGRMTYDDVVMRTGILFAIMLVTAAATWVGLATTGLISVAPIPVFLATLIITLGLGFAINRARGVPVGLICAYAVIEGVFVGTASLMFELIYPGIVITAVLGTFGAFAAMLFLYKIKALRATPKFTRWIVMLTFGYFIFAILNFAVSLLFGFSMFYSTGILGLAISLFAVGLASLNLILDFDYIDRGVANGLPEKEAWRAGFGLMVTLVWLYIEMLRLISIIRQN